MKREWGAIEGHICKFCGSSTMEGQHQESYNYKPILDGILTEVIVPAYDLVFCLNCKSDYYAKIFNQSNKGWKEE